MCSQQNDLMFYFYQPNSKVFAETGDTIIMNILYPAGPVVDHDAQLCDIGRVWFFVVAPLSNNRRIRFQTEINT